jgi:hypothetical protein
MKSAGKNKSASMRKLIKNLFLDTKNGARKIMSWPTK